MSTLSFERRGGLRRDDRAGDQARSVRADVAYITMAPVRDLRK
jgi:hypothetical protein